MKVTLHEVAARAEVSIATVSRALNGLPVSKENKARVDKAVAELGYVANEAARALRSDRTMTMGLIFSDLRNLLGIDLLDALSETIEEAGYSLLISTARGDAQRYDLLMHRFLERRVDALFCIRPRGKGETLARYRGADIPVIALFNAAGAFAGLPTIVPAFNQPAKALGEHLREAGHERVAVVRGDAAAIPVSAISEALKAQGFRIETVIAETGAVRDAVGRLMAKKARPSVLIAPDPTVRAVIAACDAAGVRTPGDVSIVSICDVTAESYHKRHDLSSITIDPHRMGRASGAAMLAWLAGSRPADKVRIQAAGFFPRASSGPAIRAGKASRA
jgi:LacI family transcriptional regulator